MISIVDDQAAVVDPRKDATTREVHRHPNLRVSFQSKSNLIFKYNIINLSQHGVDSLENSVV